MTTAQQHEAMVKEFMALKAQNAALQAKLDAKPTNGLGMKVSAKGALSVYGMGRWPVTLYKSQWQTLLAKADAIQAFIKANEAALSVKEEA